MTLFTFQHKIAWQIASQKLSTKTDNLITVVKTGKLLNVDIHPDFRTLILVYLV